MTRRLLIIILSIIQITRAEIYVYGNNSSKVIETIEDEDPTDGRTFPTSGLKGYLVRANPADACQPIAHAPSIGYPGYQWIALVRRSTDQELSCHFTTKIINAYNANFSAVVVYNYEDELLSMALSDTPTPIPSTFITSSDGFKLINKYLFNSSSSSKDVPKYYVNIVPASYFIDWPRYVIPFIAIVTTSFLCLLGFVLFRCCIERRRTRRHRLPRSALKQLQVKKFAKTDPWETCAICLDDYEEGAKLRILPCQHAYHMKCIDPWLINNRRQCPCCKRYVFPNLDNSEDENRHHHQPSPTERTPLIAAVEDDSISIRSEQRTTQPLLTTMPPIVDSSDEEKDDFLSSIPTRTTTDSRQYGSFNGSTRATNYATDTSNDEDNQAFVNDEQSIV